MNSTDENVLLHRRSELTYKMPAGLRQELLAKYTPRSRPNPFWLLGTAAVACLALWLGRISQSPPDFVAQEVVAGHVRSLMANHVLDVASEDQHTVKPWFEGKLDFAPAVKDFKEDGFPLFGGRLDYIASRPVAALVYKHGQHYINVFQWPSAAAGSSSPRLSSQRGYQLFTWSKEGMTFWLVSDVNALDLQRFAELWNK